MKKSAIAVILAALILCLAPVIVSEYAKHQPITIKTELIEGKVVPRVKLSNGELWFKTGDEVVQQYLASYAKYADALVDSLREINIPVGNEKINLNEETVRKKWENLLNQHSECWKLPDNIPRSESFFCVPNVYSDEDGKRFAIIDPIFTYIYETGRYRVRIDVTAANPQTTFFNQAGILADLKVAYGYRNLNWTGLITFEYGNMDSQIGLIPMSVRQDENSFDAAFTIANAGYFVSATGITQSEFIELLISICEAPRENTQDVVEYILEHG